MRLSVSSVTQRGTTANQCILTVYTPLNMVYLQEVIYSGRVMLKAVPVAQQARLVATGMLYDDL